MVGTLHVVLLREHLFCHSRGGRGGEYSKDEDSEKEGCAVGKGNLVEALMNMWWKQMRKLGSL